MILRSYKVMLHPNNKQRRKMFQTAGCCRFIYNWVIDTQEKNHKEGKGFISEYDMSNRLTLLKKEEKYKWLNEVSHAALCIAIKDACIAYKNFFNKRSNKPRYKSRKKGDYSFGLSNSRIKVTSTHVTIQKVANNTKRNRQKINYIKLARKDHIPLDTKYYNPRITFDGLNWWVSVSIESNVKEVTLRDDGIGVYSDYKHNLITTSDLDRYININKDKEIIRLENKIKKLSSIISNQRKLNGGIESKRIRKNKKKRLKCFKRITNIRNNYLHMISRDIINRNPKFIVMKKPNSNKKLSNSRFRNKSIYDSSIHKLSQYIAYKAEEYNIPVYVIDDYIESALCPKCNRIHFYDIIEKRIIDKSRCIVCGSIMDYQLFNANNLKKCVDNNTGNILAFTIESNIDNQYADIVVG